MNEKIKQLAEQAGCSIDGMGYGEGNVEKFAELIVKECVSLCTKQQGREYNGRASDDYQEGYRDACDECMDQIKNHFGVEE